MNPINLFLLILSLLGVTPTLQAQANNTAAKGSVIAFIGDSNTWHGGDDCSKPKAWSYFMVKNMLPKQARSFARSGATWTNNATTANTTTHYSEILHDNNVLYNQVTRLIQAVDSGNFATPDYIFISAGTNDAWFRAKRPGLYSETVDAAFARPLNANTQAKDATSLAASARLVLLRLKERFPNARIVVVGPPYTTKAPKAEIEKVADTLQKVAEKAGVGCVRIERTCGIDPDKEKVKPRLTVDGTHTSKDGAWQVANCVYNYLAFNNWLK